MLFILLDRSVVFQKYVTWLSNTLQKEYAHTNIIIQTVCPMLVTTKMSKVMFMKCYLHEATHTVTIIC